MAYTPKLPFYNKTQNRRVSKADFERINDFIAEVMELWIMDVEIVLERILRKKKLIASERLVNSMAHEIVKGGNTGVSKTFFEFEQYGRIAEMRNVRFGGKEIPFEEILSWLKDKGLSGFNYVPGYKKGQFPANKKIAQKRIASAIVKNKRKKDLKTVRKWYAKNFFQYINDLEIAILDGVSLEALAAFQQLKQ